jgi:hypothetical protein
MHDSLSHFGFVFRLVILHKRALKSAEVLTFFTTNQFVFDNDNITALLKNISSEDKIVSFRKFRSGALFSLPLLEIQL